MPFTAEAPNSDLAELFERDPLGMSVQDRGVIIKKMREYMAQFELGLRTPVAERKTPGKVKKDLLQELDLHSASEISTIIEGLGQKGLGK